MTDSDFEKRMEKAFKEHSQKYRKQYRAYKERWLPLKEKIWADIENELGRKIAEAELWMISGNLEDIRFDYFYKTDAELDNDIESGNQKFIVEAIERATKKHVIRVPEVNFHSHQFIQEKCGGNYFRYFS